MKSSVLLTALFAVLVIQAQWNCVKAQSVGIATTAITPDASSILEVQSNNKGLLIPRIALTATNAAGPVASPAASLLVYNTATAGTSPNNVAPGYYYWDATTSRWIRLLGNKDAWTTTGNNGLSAATNFLGNTDSVDLVIKTNNFERMRIDAHGRVGINTSKYHEMNMLTVKGRAGILITGTASITNGTATVTGTGTSFLSNASAGDLIYITDGGTTNQINVIDTVNTNTSISCLLNFSVTDAACQIYIFPSSFQVTDAGEDPLSTVIIDNMGELGVGITYPFGYGRITGYETAQYGVGVYGSNTNANGNGVYGVNSAAAGTGADGDAVVGFTRQSGSAGGWFSNGHTSGTGVMGSGNNATTMFLSFGSGGAFTGTRVGAYGVEADSLTSGTGYTQGYSGVYGKALFRNAANQASFYHFGVSGEFWNNSTTRNAGRSGGVLGYGETNASSCWGSLGYVTSTYALAGVYGSTAYSTGAGKSSNQPAAGYGVIGDGSMMGGMFHGDVYGLTASGDRFGLMVMGNTYTDQFYSVLAKTGTDQYTPLYAPVTEKVTVYTSGKGKLVNGKAVIKFSDQFSQLVSSDQDIVVTVTPLGASSGLYVSSTTVNGFEVMENKGPGMSKGSTTDFNYIVIATRKGYENPQNPSEMLNDEFISGAKRFMTSERPNSSSSPFWWDGTKLRTDEIPAGIMPQQQGFQIKQKSMETEDELKNKRIDSKLRQYLPSTTF